MIWTHCACGHRIEQHYMGGGKTRHGPCKEGRCGCQAFKETEIRS